MNFLSGLEDKVRADENLRQCLQIGKLKTTICTDVSRCFEKSVQIVVTQCFERKGYWNIIFFLLTSSIVCPRALSNVCHSRISAS